MDEIETTLNTDRTIGPISRGLLCQEKRALDRKRIWINDRLNEISNQESTAEKIARLKRRKVLNSQIREKLQKKTEPEITEGCNEERLEALKQEYKALNKSDAQIDKELQILEDLQLSEAIDKSKSDINNNLSKVNRYLPMYA